MLLSIIFLLFLVASATLGVLEIALKSKGAVFCRKEFEKYPKFYAPLSLIQKLIPSSFESLIHYVKISHRLSIVFYTTTFLIEGLPLFSSFFYYPLTLILSLTLPLLLLFLELLLSLLFQTIYSKGLKVTVFFSFPLLLLFFPLTYPLMRLQTLLSKPTIHSPSSEVKNKLQELIEETQLNKTLDPLNKQLITSVASFGERLVREVMIPRVDIFCLPSEVSVHESARQCIEEGYSRIPIYEENVDNMIGVLLYKDVLEYYFNDLEKEQKTPHTTPIKTLIKPLLYTPETKKISHLLQEFRTHQTHLALVVDEYGGTAGLVTIEDILEELVGDIADEYDNDETLLLFPLKDGRYIADPKLSIIDLENQLNIPFPHSPEYDTIGGYIFHLAGSIPAKGWSMQSNHFQLKVLRSSDRAIEKIEITPMPKEGEKD